VDEVSPSVCAGDWAAISSTAFAAVGDCSACSLANRLWKGVTAHCLFGSNVTRVLVVIDRDPRTSDVGCDCRARKAARRKIYLLQGKGEQLRLVGVAMTYILSVGKDVLQWKDAWNQMENSGIFATSFLQTLGDIAKPTMPFTEHRGCVALILNPQPRFSHVIYPF
jgi:hypothetical protein